MLNKLKEWHEEELADEIKYMEFSKEAPEAYKSIFRDISREEGSHARILEAIINDYKEVCNCNEETVENNEGTTTADEIKPIENRKIVLDV